MKKNILYLALLLVSFTFVSCEKEYLEVDPTASVSEAAVFTTTTNAWAAINGIHRTLYAQFGNMDEAGQSGIMMDIDFLGDDLVMHATGNGWFNNTHKWINHRNENSALVYFAYRHFYRIIGNANMIIANIENAEGPTADKNSIKGQALAYRAWSHWVMVQFYAKRYDWTQKPNSQPGIPLILEPTTEGFPRSTVEEVYAQSMKDINEAITLLQAGVTGKAKSHISVRAAQGIKARIALAMGDWATAQTAANAARTGLNLMSQAQVLEGFNNINNPEVIWGSFVQEDQTTYFHSFFAFMSWNFSSTFSRTNPIKINSALYDKISATDIRKKLFVEKAADVVVPLTTFVKTNHHAIKFTAVGVSDSRGDVPYMRVAEMILVEAEALARQNKFTEAQDLLFVLAKNRDANYVKTERTGQELIDEILLQRRIELWGEGFRWTDLKRMNLPLNRNGANHNPSLAQIFDVPPGDLQWVWKIPKAELDANKNIGDQNP